MWRLHQCYCVFLYPLLFFLLRTKSARHPSAWLLKEMHPSSSGWGLPVLIFLTRVPLREGKMRGERGLLGHSSDLRTDVPSSQHRASREIVPVPRPRTILSCCQKRTRKQQRTMVRTCHVWRKKGIKSNPWVRFLVT